MARAALRELEAEYAVAAAVAKRKPADPAAWRRKLLSVLLAGGGPLPDLLLPRPPEPEDDGSVALAAAEAAARRDRGDSDGGGWIRPEDDEDALEARVRRGLGWRLERASASTRENALRTLEMARAEGWRSLAVVTSPWHARRALATFRKAAAEEAAAAGGAGRWGGGGGVTRVEVVLAADDDGERGGGVGGLGEAFDASVREGLATLLYRVRGWV